MTLLTDLGRNNLWNQPVYAEFRKEIDPFRDLQYFRNYLAYDGQNAFWTKPCPEPNLEEEFWHLVLSKLADEKLQLAATRLASAIISTAPDPSKLLFVAILRGGVPIADWLCRLLPGSVAVALSLFVGIGIDGVALQKARSDYPDREIIFVDGWTGKGGVARELSKLEIGPLAVLIDPWGWADFAGAVDDLFCPTACFTGVATLGFSSGFYVDDRSLFSSYLFPEAYCRPELVTTWQNACPQFLAPTLKGGATGTKPACAGSDLLSKPLPVKVSPTLKGGATGTKPACAGSDLLSKPLADKQPFWLETDLRIHSNEVCRGLLNANPDTLYFADDRTYVREHYSLILALAERRRVNIVYNAKHLADYQTRVACSFQK
ncbi:MAG: hypothetical protein GDA56_11020 [Hormoscilla sp. GM7CHS1pb]|nr:hypothetical protein [Hormoscilla sp. GM7CHS1pb]